MVNYHIFMYISMYITLKDTLQLLNFCRKRLCSLFLHDAIIDPRVVKYLSCNNRSNLRLIFHGLKISYKGLCNAISIFILLQSKRLSN